MDGNFVLFEGSNRLARGTILEVAKAAWKLARSDPTKTTLTFNCETGDIVDLDLSGTSQNVENRYAPPAKPRGRPKLGVTAREVTLLPQHWEWLARQPGGASVALRRLIEATRKDSSGHEANRQRISSIYKFMSAMAGDLPNFEEASRALFAQQKSPFEKHISSWPKDIQGELTHMVALLRWPNA